MTALNRRKLYGFLDRVLIGALLLLVMLLAGIATARAGQLVPSEVELIGAGVVRRVRGGRRRSPRQRERERLHHTPGDVVLQPEQITQRRQNGVRREQRS